MIKFFLGMLVGIILTVIVGIVVLAFVGAYRENEKLEKKIKEYEEKEKE